MNYRSFNLGDWIGHISGVIEDESTLDGNEMMDLVEFLTTLKQEPKMGHWIKENSVLRCSECGGGVARYDRYHYCPNCGCHMEVDDANSN